MNMYGTFWALIPPLVAIILALITKEAYSSLFVGVLIGAFFVVGFPTSADGIGSFLAGTMNTVVNDGLIAAISGTAGIFLFLIILGIIVALINKAGGSAAFGRWAEKNIKSRVGAQLATFALGVLIFVDDYFNCLTVGSVMRPITDRSKISRAKLSYLIDATAAPVCMIAPVSSWAAAVSSVAADADTGISGIQLFINLKADTCYGGCMAKKPKIIGSNDIMLSLCQSVASVLTSATGKKTAFVPLIQKISKTVLTPDIGTFVMFTGSFSGMVVINFPKETAMELYKSYLGNMGLPESEMAKNYTQDEVSNSLGELMNQMIGDFTRQVSDELHIRIDQSQPKMLVLPREVQINISVDLDNPIFGKVTFNTESGNVFYVELAMDDTTFTAIRDFETKNTESPDDILEQYKV